MLRYIQVVLRANVRRSNIQVKNLNLIFFHLSKNLNPNFLFKTNESIVAGDGFMLNMLFVLQELARPVKSEKVELLAIFDEKQSPIPVKSDEPKLNCNKEKYEEWIASLGK
jgi:hypothetical protein